MKVAELFLIAQYYGALKYAALAAKEENRRRKVFLMPLGIGGGIEKIKLLTSFTVLVVLYVMRIETCDMKLAKVGTLFFPKFIDPSTHPAAS